MTLVLILLSFSALCWAVVLWGWRNRLKQRTAEALPTELVRASFGRRQLSRQREHQRNHLRLVSSKQR